MRLDYWLPEKIALTDVKLLFVAAFKQFLHCCKCNSNLVFTERLKSYRFNMNIHYLMGSKN